MRRFLLAALAAVALAPLASALTPAQLTPQERATYNSLTDQTAKTNFMITRTFVRQCKQVMAGTLPAIKLPMQPDEFDYNYCSPEESKAVDSAVIKNAAAIINSPTSA